MCAKWVLLVVIVNIHLKSISTQYYNQYYPNMPQFLIQQDDEDEYEINPAIDDLRRSRKRYNDDNSDAVIDASDAIAVGFNPNPNPNNLVFVPYPFPLVIPNMLKNNTADNSTEVKSEQETVDTTTGTTTTTTTTTTTKTTTAPTTTEKPTTTTLTSPPNGLRTNILADGMISGRRNIKQLNPAAKRRTRPAWVPKYGIVPIPDNLAAKLMSQLTEVRALKARRL